MRRSLSDNANQHFVSHGIGIGSCALALETRWRLRPIPLILTGPSHPDAARSLHSTRVQQYSSHSSLPRPARKRGEPAAAAGGVMAAVTVSAVSWLSWTLLLGADRVRVGAMPSSVTMHASTLHASN